MIAQRRTYTHSRTRHRTQSVKDHNVIRVGRELSCVIFNYMFPFFVSGVCSSRQEWRKALCECEWVWFTSPFPSSIMSMCPDIVSWCINKSLQSTISIYYLDRKYEPLCERAVLRVECYFVFTFCLTAFSAPVQSIVHWKYINEWELKIYNIWQTITIAWCGRFSTTFISIVHHCWGVCVCRWWWDDDVVKCDFDKLSTVA